MDLPDVAAGRGATEKSRLKSAEQTRFSRPFLQIEAAICDSRSTAADYRRFFERSRDLLNRTSPLRIGPDDVV